MTHESLRKYVGRRALYIEGGKVVVVRVESVTASPAGMSAMVAFDGSVPISCRLRRIRYADEDRAESWGQDCPFGDRWEIGEQWSFFEFDEERWGATQVGFRLLFAEDVIDRFARQDLSWVDEHYG